MYDNELFRNSTEDTIRNVKSILVKYALCQNIDQVNVFSLTLSRHTYKKSEFAKTLQVFA